MDLDLDSDLDLGGEVTMHFVTCIVIDRLLHRRW